MAADETERLTVTVSFSPGAGEVDDTVLQLGRGATVADAVSLSGVIARHPALGLAGAPTGVWGERCEPARPLRDGDRVEIYRPLTVDPKEARRLRYRATAGSRLPKNHACAAPASSAKVQAKPSR